MSCFWTSKQSTKQFKFMVRLWAIIRSPDFNLLQDYLGVGMGSRTPESKRAVAEATNVFQSHYPELLVSFWPLSRPRGF